MTGMDPGVKKAGASGVAAAEAYRPFIAQEVATGGTAAPAAPFDAQTRLIRVVAHTSDVRIEIGPTPTAKATSLLLPVGVPEYFAIDEGDALSAIQDSAAGSLNITEMQSIGQA